MTSLERDVFAITGEKMEENSQWWDWETKDFTIWTVMNQNLVEINSMSE